MISEYKIESQQTEGEIQFKTYLWCDAYDTLDNGGNW